MLFWYDENSSPIGFVYTDKTTESPTSHTFFYSKNAFSDILGIFDETGKGIASYWYNEWGEWVDAVWDTSEELYCFLLNNNPLLYRGYYYDIETNYYYLQSRYYNPTWHRFINADDVKYIGVSGNYLGVNAYLYCENDSVDYNDPTGNLVVSIGFSWGGAIFVGLNVFASFLFDSSGNFGLLIGVTLIYGFMGSGFSWSLGIFWDCKKIKNYLNSITTTYGAGFIYGGSLVYKYKSRISNKKKLMGIQLYKGTKAIFRETIPFDGGLYIDLKKELKDYFKSCKSVSSKIAKAKKLKLKIVWR